MTKLKEKKEEKWEEKIKIMKKGSEIWKNNNKYNNFKEKKQ